MKEEGEEGASDDTKSGAGCCLVTRFDNKTITTRFTLSLRQTKSANRRKRSKRHRKNEERVGVRGERRKKNNIL